MEMLVKSFVVLFFYLNLSVTVEGWWPFRGDSGRASSPGELLRCKGKKECAKVIKELGARARKSKDPIDILRYNYQLVAVIQAKIQLGDVRGAVALLKPSNVCDVVDLDILNMPSGNRPNDDEKYWDTICGLCNKGKASPTLRKVCSKNDSESQQDLKLNTKLQSKGKINTTEKSPEYQEMLRNALGKRREAVQENFSEDNTDKSEEEPTVRRTPQNRGSTYTTKEFDLHAVSDGIYGQIERFRQKGLLRSTEGEESDDIEVHSSGTEWSQ